MNRKKKGGKRKRNAKQAARQKQKRLAKSPRQMFRKVMPPPDQVIEPQKGGAYNRQEWRKEAQREVSGEKDISLFFRANNGCWLCEGN